MRVRRTDRRADDVMVAPCHRRPMIDLTREMIAYALIGGSAAIGAIYATVALRRRRRVLLRRQGIKRYGH